MSSTKRFGFEWATYSELEPYEKEYEKQFLNWVYPLAPSYFTGKSILDAGCGMGRNSYWCLHWGAHDLVAFDANERTVAAARRTLKPFPQARVVLADIYDLPWENQFDLVLSIGVIHHLAEPIKAAAQLKKALSPGGEILLWVYSRPGFEGWLFWLDPIRRQCTSKISPPVLHLLTYVASIPFYVWLHAGWSKRPYFRQLRSFSFSHVHSILFDQLLPDIARYLSHEEAAALLAGFTDVSVTMPPNKNGWVVRGRKP